MMEIDDEILRILRDKPKTELTTYEVAHKLTISWSTANIHLQKLATEQKIKSSRRMIKHTKKIFWSIPIITHKVHRVSDHIFHGTGCLESGTQLGFFKSEADVRPSSCMWIDKDKAERLFEIIKRGY